MVSTKARREAVEKWLFKSASNLKSAKLLYDGKQWEDSLAWLQQSNEKLDKALLLAIGFLSPKQTKMDWRVKEALGFLPKQPRQYRHSTTHSLISDLEKSIPSVEKYMKIIENSELGPQFKDFREAVRASEESLKKLKKTSFGPIKTTEQLANEVKAAQHVLDALDQTKDTVKTKLAELELDSEKLLRIATSAVEKAGYKPEPIELGPIDDKMKAVFESIFRLVVLQILSEGLASFLNPLVSTRYPDSECGSIDENDSYIQNFMGLYDVIGRILEQTREVLKSQSNINAGH